MKVGTEVLLGFAGCSVAVLVVVAAITMLAGLRLALRGRLVAGITGTLGAAFLAMATLMLPVAFTLSAVSLGKMNGLLKALTKLMEEDIFLASWGVAALFTAFALTLHAVSLWSGGSGYRDRRHQGVDGAPADDGLDRGAPADDGLDRGAPET